MTYDEGLGKAAKLFEELKDSMGGDARKIFKQVIKMDELFSRSIK